MQRTLLLILIALVIQVAQAQTVWNGTTDTRWYDSQPSNMEFTISTAEELAGLAELVNNGEPFTGKTITLGADILLNDTTNWKNWDTQNEGLNQWTPIGRLTYERPFKGSFNGAGYVIAGIYIRSNSTFEQGLFGYAYGYITIKNVGLKAFYIRCGGGSYYVNNVGSLVGYIHSEGGISSESTISHCYSEGYVYGRGESIGGLIGFAFCDIDNCYNISEVSGGSQKVGGLIGWSNGGLIKDCYNTGKVNGGTNVGGLIGYNAGPLTKCYNTGHVTGNNSTGGLLGGTGGAEVIDCKNSGDVTGVGNYMSNIGGLFGNNGSIIVDNCLNTGNVTAASGEYVGGLSGYSNGTLKNSSNTGEVRGRALVGGLAGYGNITTIEDCVNVGKVFGNNDLGGLLGQSNITNITYSSNLGDVTGTANHIGGLVGYNGFNDATIITNCFNKGNVIGADSQNGQQAGSDYVGGIIGYNDIAGSIKIRNTYNTGNVSASNYVGGLGGFNESTTIINCYNAGSVTGYTNLGGLLGKKEGGSVTYSYWRTDGDGGQINGSGSGTFSTGAMGKTTTELKSSDFITLMNDRARALNNNDIEKPYNYWGSDIENDNKGYIVFGAASVNFDKNGVGASEIVPGYVVCSKDDNVALPADPTREGYIFSGWRTTADSTGDEFITSTPVDTHITVYAFWRKILTVDGTTISKEYDGTTDVNPETANISVGQTEGIEQEYAHVWAEFASATFDNKTAGTDKSITCSYKLVSNDNWRYIIYPATFTSGIITPLTLTNNVEVTPKIYDGNDIANFTGGLTNVIVGDDVTLNATLYYYGGEDVQSNTMVLARLWEITGTDAPNYTLPALEWGYLSGSIIPAPQSITFAPETTISLGDGSYILSATTTSGLDVSFRLRAEDAEYATINGNELTLLKAGQIEVTAYVDSHHNYESAAEIPVIVTISESSDIDNSNIKAPECTIVDGEIKLSGLTEGDMLSVYNPQGTVVYQQKTISDKHNFRLSTRGVYIIMIGTYNLKVVY